ncbi:MAG TPA: amidase [Solirubrobacteraceae bacterium]|jgi:aspartyl-tRNA(Asn)/glutamyl-tRNA(Gln) amidotransferase subunit A|nr:amidase [Solirubrobacteraceae bacterium]
MTDLADLTAVDLARAYEIGDCSPSEALRAVRARIDQWEPTINALWHRDDAEADRQAKAAEERWRAGEPLSPLDGVPVTLKENIATAGVATPLGSQATILAPAPRDAPAAARLKEAGAVLVAKTTMPDFGMLTSGVSTKHGTTRSPWNPDWNTGGSSSGAAAATVAGYAPINIGTDIGGSVRLPAAFTGVVGHKGSFGRVPVNPPYYARVVGPLTRTVADAARAMAVLSRPDDADFMSLPPQDLGWDHLEIRVAGIRIAVTTDAGAGMPTDPEVARAVEFAATTLGDAGAAVERIGPLITDAMLGGLDRFWRMRSLRDLRALPPENQERMLPYLREWMDAAADRTGMELFHDFSQLEAISMAARDAFDGFDFILCPVAPVATFSADLPSPAGDPGRALEHIAYTVTFSISGHPAVSVPWSTTEDGRPIGIQLVGRRFADLPVLALGAACELLRPRLPPWPAPPAGAVS